MKAYVIWSHEHGAWWRAGGWGYTQDVLEAGRYSREEALRICANALPGHRLDQGFPEIPVLVADIADFVALAQQ